MTEVLPYGITATILRRLGSSAIEEFGLIYNVKDELKKLERTLSTINAVLLDAEEKQEKSHAVRNWVMRLQEAVYDAADLLDDFATEDLRLKVDDHGRFMGRVRYFFSSSNQIAFRAKMGHRVKDIRERLDEVAVDISRFNFLENIMFMPNKNSHRETNSMVLKSQVLGREKQKNEIIELLLRLDNLEDVSIVAIVGLGGLGKTALAQLVYNDEKVNETFECLLWVCVSIEFNVKMLLKNVLKAITRREVGDLNIEAMHILLREKLEGKIYLIVLDDLWNENERNWTEFKTFLQGGVQGSKILVTTRNIRVATVMGIDSPYFLTGLLEDDSWTLFEKVALTGDQKDYHSNLRTIGREVVKRCKGVPLAIWTLGCIMRSNVSESHWFSIHETDIWRLPQNDVDIFPVLKSSYNQLPVYLRQCFAYCSIFPKDFRISKEMLIQLWLAQGYIQSLNEIDHCNNVFDWENIGNQYLNDLISRSFFQDVKKDDHGNILSFKMHDLVQELAQLIAGRSCSVMDVDRKHVADGVRHVFFEGGLQHSEEIWRSLLQTRGLKTLFFNKGRLVLLDAVIPNFERLRVLVFSNLGIRQLPGWIGKLKEMRYLDLSYNEEMEILPNSISNLHNLQTLVLSGCKMLVCLPRGIKKWINLKYLIIDGCWSLTHMPAGLKYLTSIRRLSYFNVSREQDISSCAMLNELNGLNYLSGEICLRKLENVRDPVVAAKEANLKDKKYLVSLKLQWGSSKVEAEYFVSLRSQSGFIKVNPENFELLLNYLQPHPNLKKLEVSGFGGLRFSSWLSSITNLVNVTIQDCENCREIPPLDQLPYLRVLFLDRLHALECIYLSDFFTGRGLFFPSLAKLKLTNCCELKGWQRKDDKILSTAKLPPLPCLSELVITNCPSLTDMPSFPTIEGELWLSNTSLKPLRELISVSPLYNLKSMILSEMQDIQLVSLEEWQNLSSLKILKIWSTTFPANLLLQLTSLESLEIRDCPKLVSLPETSTKHSTQLLTLSVADCQSLRELYFNCSFHSLRSLEVKECQSLRSLSGILQNIPALKELYISDCENLDISDIKGRKFLCLKMLSSLSIKGLPMLVRFPVGFRYLASLKQLHIQNCKKLDSVEGVFQCLTALEELKIESCCCLNCPDICRQFENPNSFSMSLQRCAPRFEMFEDTELPTDAVPVHMLKGRGDRRGLGYRTLRIYYLNYLQWACIG